MLTWVQVTPNAGTPIVNVLTAADDTVDFPSGWERYITAYAAVQALIKEESDPRPLQAELQRIENELEAMKLNRDTAEPNQVVDMDYDDTDPRYIDL